MAGCNLFRCPLISHLIHPDELQPYPELLVSATKLPRRVAGLDHLWSRLLRDAEPTSNFTRILNSAQEGDEKAAEELLKLVYDELRKLAAVRMAMEQPGQTLQPTALVHEAWLRLGADQQPRWQNRAHFFAAAAEAMRRILIDRARKRKVRLASGLANPQLFEDSKIEVNAGMDELLALHEVLDQLAKIDPDAARLVKLRYFVGMNMSQTAEALGLPLRNAERLWTFAKAWLRDAIRRES